MGDEADERAVEASGVVADRRQGALIERIRAGLEADGSDDCADCGGEIGKARRAAMPSATRCVGCQERLERRGK